MAKWLEDGRPCSIMFKCSECGEKAYFVHGKARGRNKEKRFCGYRYCPWCGAKMTIIEAEPDCTTCPVKGKACKVFYRDKGDNSVCRELREAEGKDDS